MADAVSSSDVTVLAVPLSAYPQFPARLFADRTVVDTTNYYPDRFGHLESLDASGLPSSAFLQKQWPEAHIGKALNTMDYVQLESLAAAPQAVHTAVPVAGDDPTSVTLVSELVRTLGFEPLDAGPLAQTWRFQPGTPLHVQAYLRYREDATDDALEHFLHARSVPVDASETRRLLAEAG